MNQNSSKMILCFKITIFRTLNGRRLSLNFHVYTWKPSLVWTLQSYAVIILNVFNNLELDTILKLRGKNPSKLRNFNSSSVLHSAYNAIYFVFII